MSDRVLLFSFGENGSNDSLGPFRTSEKLPLSIGRADVENIEKLAESVGAIAATDLPIARRKPRQPLSGVRSDAMSPR